MKQRMIAALEILIFGLCAGILYYSGILPQEITYRVVSVAAAIGIASLLFWLLGGIGMCYELPLSAAGMEVCALPILFAQLPHTGEALFIALGAAFFVWTAVELKRFSFVILGIDTKDRK